MIKKEYVALLVFSGRIRQPTSKPDALIWIYDEKSKGAIGMKLHFFRFWRSTKTFYEYLNFGGYRAFLADLNHGFLFDLIQDQRVMTIPRLNHAFQVGLPWIYLT